MATPDGSKAGRSLQFLPVNQLGSPPEVKRRRAYQSCEPCRRRKSRCVPEKAGQRQPCKRCVAENQQCDFRDTRSVQRRTGRAQGGRSEDAGTSSASSLPAPVSHEVGVPQGNVDVEVNSAPCSNWFDLTGNSNSNPGSDPDIHIPVPTPMQKQQLLVGSQDPDTASNHSSPSTNPTARSRIISAQLHNTADALDLLTFTAAGERENPHDGSSRIGATPSANSSDGLGLRGGASWDWEKFVLIKKGVITKSEVIEYLDHYFAVMWPLRPVVHPLYRDKNQYTQLLTEEPLLSISLITVSSRYHPLSGSHGEIRSERIHWQSWKFLRKHIQSALWGSPYTRSPGAIAAMLLMIEWHSKSINNPVEFSKEEDHDILSSQIQRQAISNTQSGQLTSLTSQQRYGMTNLLESLNIVAPAYRSNKMSWMLLSTAIALAHEGCCFDHESQGPGFQASENELHKQQWNQLLCVFLYLTDENLAMRLGLNPLLPEKSSDTVQNRYSTTFASILPDTAIWESYFDLSTETRKARSLLQSLKKGGLTFASVNILPELAHIERALARWKRQHACLNSSETALLGACLDIEYHYSVMYSFAPASNVLHHVSTESTEGKANDVEVAALIKLADQATQASQQILSIVVNVLQPSQLMRYLPVRCWVFIVAANIHLLKSVLTGNPDVTEADENMQLIRASIIAIRNGSPDDTHMAVRYAQFLEILLDASLRSSKAQSPAGENIGPDAAAATGTENVDWGYYTTSISAIDSLATFNLSSGIGPQMDSLLWWDGAFGLTGNTGFY
ncbi:hypothetical protein AOL_s00215g722 [Orbilia oligospora ATCC 24927]|uniref:Zn(2)-C6 fungal-type domain-containing protein n=2 Tax=Orbilia oligospora TaxID=2813651 RepID=G1XUR4_ARTOA|nr:hypothetical protein AOL_s00215g722 [Orbilia oligospora ATCC 24927]EGX43113.1 hypothetical protein AOL_s00215g722 [Orbilia oligospora ATCC 24927]